MSQLESRFSSNLSQSEQPDYAPSFKFNGLLALPRELRDQIIGEVLFPGEQEPDDLDQDRYGLAATARRQIWPYHPDAAKLPRIDVSVLRVSRQLQAEGEAILYGSSSFNLMYDDWRRDRPKLSYQFFERLPKRLRRLIQRVERKCYSETYSESIPLFEWNAFTRFLAEECPSLHTLKLWGPGDRNEGSLWINTCTQEHEWVQCLLQIKTLKFFDIPVIKGGNIYEFPQFRDSFLPLLKRALTSQRKRKQPELKLPRDFRFPFLQLPSELRQGIYKEVLLSHDRNVYIDMKPWFNKEMQAARSLMLTCKQVHTEVELIISKEYTFYSDRPRISETPFASHLRGRLNIMNPSNRLREYSGILGELLGHKTLRIRHADILYGTALVIGKTISDAGQRISQLESLTLRIEVTMASRIHDNFNNFSRLQAEGEASSRQNESGRQSILEIPWRIEDFYDPFDGPFPLLLRSMASFPNIVIRRAESPCEVIDEDWTVWFVAGLRDEWMKDHVESSEPDWWE